MIDELGNRFQCIRRCRNANLYLNVQAVFLSVYFKGSYCVHTISIYKLEENKTPSCTLGCLLTAFFKELPMALSY